MRPARKEYSDLSPSQKHTYVLENTIHAIFAGVFSVLYMAFLIVGTKELLGYADILQSDLMVGLILLSTAMVVIGGLTFGYMVKIKYKLYTDIDLEEAERKVLKIKDALD